MWGYGGGGAIGVPTGNKVVFNIKERGEMKFGGPASQKINGPKITFEWSNLVYYV